MSRSSVKSCKIFYNKLNYSAPKVSCWAAENPPMASTLGKQGKGRGKSSQSKIEFTPGKPSGEATANASAMAEESSETTDESANPQPILEAIKDLKADFCSRFDGVLTAVEERSQ